MLLYVPLQMRAAWRAERSAGAAATMALPMKALMMVEASILVVILELKVKLVEENMVRWYEEEFLDEKGMLLYTRRFLMVNLIFAVSRYSLGWKIVISLSSSSLTFDDQS
jgi:hypothetical protein